jgi:hypothetical protein
MRNVITILVPVRLDWILYNLKISEGVQRQVRCQIDQQAPAVWKQPGAVKRTAFPVSQYDAVVGQY